MNTQKNTPITLPIVVKWRGKPGKTIIDAKLVDAVRAK
jgi:hypothetical protein